MTVIVAYLRTGQHRKPTSVTDRLAGLAARLVDAGAVMLTGLIAGIAIFVAVSALFGVLIYFVGGR